jgi:outer membrane protein OmpA-like peptidoglycan-associated protein
VCSLSGSIVTFLATGTCVLDANQAGAGNILAAPQVQQSVTVFAAVHVGVPSAPVNVAVVTSAGGVTVSWAAPTSNGGDPVTGYLVTAEPGGSTCSTSGAMSCDLSGLAPGTTYTISVVALNSVGDSVNTETIYASTGLGAPTDVTVTGQNGDAVISWAAPTVVGEKITGYDVTVTGSNAHCATTGATTCTVSGLVDGVTYTFKVVALTATGSSRPSRSKPTMFVAIEHVALRTHFAFASYTLTPRAKSALRAFARTVKSLHVRSLTLLGYTDDVGTSTYNKALSRERAASVGVYLTAQFHHIGYRSFTIREQGKGVLRVGSKRADDRTVTISY